MKSLFSRGGDSGDLIPNKPQERESTIGKMANVIFIVTMAIAVVFLALVTRQNAKLRLEASQYRGTLAGPQTSEVGDIVPPFLAFDLEGQPAPLVYDESATYLIYIFSPGCDVCSSQISLWNHLASQAKPRNIRVIGLTIDSADVASRHLKTLPKTDFRIMVIPNRAIQRAYRVVSIPEVMLVSPKGVVEWVHYGEMSDAETKDLSARIESR